MGSSKLAILNLTRSASIPLLVLIGLVVSVGVTLLSVFDVSFITTDTAQYISVARHLSSGEGFKTSLIYFDAHFAQGGIPVYETIWPPGYPVLIFLTSLTGIPAVAAPFAVSLAALVLAPLVLFRIGRLSGLTGALAVLIAAGWLAFGYSWSLVLGGTTEITYVLLSLLAIFFVAKGLSSSTGRFGSLLVAGMFAGASVSVRYPGLFLVLAVGLFLSYRFLRKASWKRFKDIIAVNLIPVIVIASLFTRNYLLTGNLTSNSYVPREQSIYGVLQELYWAVGKLTGAGEGGFTFLLVWAMVLLLIALAAGALLPTRVTHASQQQKAAAAVVGLSTTYIVVTLLALVYFSLTITAGFVNDRYLLPLIPPVLILSGIGWQRIGERYTLFKSPGTRAGACATLLAVFLYGQLNVLEREWSWYQVNDSYRTIDSSLNLRLGEETVRDYLLRNISNERPLLAPNGQHLGAILNRPVVGLPAPLYTENNWDTVGVYALVNEYNISHVIFFPAQFDVTKEWDSNRLFFAAIENGEVPPWLSPVLQSEQIVVYKVLH